MSQNGNRGWRVFDLLARTRDQRGSLRQCRYCHLPPWLLFCHKHQGVVKNCPKTIASTVAYNRKVPIMVPSPELNVSLEPHLSDALSPLQAVLPEPLRSQLLRTLEQRTNARNHAMPVVPYALLSSISAWTRSAEGLAALQGCKPPLQSSDYSMIALLAGTRTAPDRKYPTNFAPLDRDNQPLSPRDLNDRRAITTLFNALLSILGSGVATWWAADRLLWQNEWVGLLQNTDQLSSAI